MGEGRAFPVGKIEAAFLQHLLERYAFPGERVVLGPRIGEDVAAVEMGDRCLVVTCDPITFATEAIGWYAVHINANDLATSGAEPRWFLATLLLPEGRTDKALAESIFRQVYEACLEVGVGWIGGHTEVTHGLDRPILVGTMLGEVEREGLVTTGGARVGDALLLTKGIAVEGTALIAREARERLLEMGFSAEMLNRAAAFLYQPGISVLPEARVIRATCRVNSLHDPTEGGLATGLHEVAQAAGVGIVVEMEQVPIFPETRALCEALGLDPLGLLASGSLLVTLPEAEAPRLRERLLAAGIQANIIGRVVPAKEGLSLQREGQRFPLPRFDQDEVARLFA